MQTEKELILKIIFGQTKFKHCVKYTSTTTILNLKRQIYEQLKRINAINNEKLEQIQIYDDDEFLFVDNDKIDSLIKNNDTVQVKFNASNSSSSMPSEAICVLYDISGSMDEQFYDDDKLSRIGAVNSWFSAFADKTLAFQMNHLVQLICFSSKINVRGQFSADFENFIQLVNDVQTSGSTKLYDAIKVAIDNLLKIQKSYSNIILRIIALTDGEDNSSQIKPQKLLKKIIKHQIIIDSFVVGKNCVGLKTLTHASGGRCYRPTKLAKGMKLFEIETILSVKARQNTNSSKYDSNTDLKTLESLPFDKKGIESSKEKMKQQAGKPEIILKQLENSVDSSSTSAKRILKELRDYIKNPIENVKIFPIKDNIYLWKALLIGPKGTFYNQGCYLLSIQFSQNYPSTQPNIQFQTQIYHCNISQQGSTCLEWSSSQSTIPNIIKEITELLQKPNQQSAMNSDIASLMIHEYDKYKQKVIKKTKKFANQSVDTLAKQIFGNFNSLNQSEQDNIKDEIQKWIKNNRE